MGFIQVLPHDSNDVRNLIYKTKLLMYVASLDAYDAQSLRLRLCKTFAQVRTNPIGILHSSPYFACSNWFKQNNLNDPRLAPSMRPAPATQALSTNSTSRS